MRGGLEEVDGCFSWYTTGEEREAEEEERQRKPIVMSTNIASYNYHLCNIKRADQVLINLLKKTIKNKGDVMDFGYDRC